MSTNRTLLALFVILTVAFATLSAFEYAQLAWPESGKTSSAAREFPSHGFIQILDGTALKTFTYIQWNSSTPNPFSVSNVRFARWTNGTVANTDISCHGAVGGFVITFPDNLTERMTTCTAEWNALTVMRLTNHINPQAGLLIIPATGEIYLLVSM